MIFDADAQLVVGNMGWIDKGALRIFNLRNHEETRIPVEGSQFVSLRAGANGFFRLVHHQSSDQAVSVRHIQRPELELASVRLKRGCVTFLGDADVWRQVDPAFVFVTESNHKLALIDATQNRVTELDLSWYTNGAYDLGYQGLVDCITLESSDLVIVAVQRSSTLVVIDPNLNKPVESIALADRGGNPQLEKCGDGNLFASDYDTLCRIDIRSLAVLRSARLQDATGHTQQFIGGFDISSGHLVVARPFSGDVLLLDLDDFRMRGQARVAGQPLAACMLSDRRVMTRDWKTGRVSLGQF